MTKLPHYQYAINKLISKWAAQNSTERHGTEKRQRERERVYTCRGCRWSGDRDQSDTCQCTQTVRRCPAPWLYEPTVSNTQTNSDNNTHTHQHMHMHTETLNVDMYTSHTVQTWYTASNWKYTIC